MADEIITQPTETTENALALPKNQMPTMWNDPQHMKHAFAAAKYLASMDFVPVGFKGNAANCLLVIDIVNRTNLSPLMIMQNLYVVNGRPAWSGQFSIGLVNNCGRFSPLEFVFVGEPNELDYGCYAQARRLATGELVKGTTITMQMAKDEGWLAKSGSKWKTMPDQMMRYRAGAFFARAYCPEALLGLQTAEELQDVYGYKDQDVQTTTITID